MVVFLLMVTSSDLLILSEEQIILFHMLFTRFTLVNSSNQKLSKFWIVIDSLMAEKQKNNRYKLLQMISYQRKIISTKIKNCNLKMQLCIFF